MRVDVPGLADEVAGTTQGDRLEVTVWRGGQLVVPDPLDVSRWSLSWDAGRQVQGQASLTFADPDGALAPWSMGDPLGPGGSRLQVVYVFGLTGTRVPLGWWRIRSVDPVEEWRVYGVGESVVRVPGGGSVSVQADEETATAVLARLDAETVRASTVVAEVRRLLEDVCPVVAHDAVTDRPVPSGYVYDEGRMDGVEDLLDTIHATHRMGGDGSLEIVPVTGVGPVWTIAGGESGAQVKTVRSLSDDGVYNAAVSYGERADGRPRGGGADLTTGPPAWGGPFGQVPTFHQAVAVTQDGVNADARTVLATSKEAGDVDLRVTCLTHPGVQLHDLVTVMAATTAGEHALVGRVVGMSMTSADSDAGTTPAKSMTLTVRVTAEALEAVAWRVRRG
jgi:hypothetical protein